jgi:hypothetical protein
MSMVAFLAGWPSGQLTVPVPTEDGLTEFGISAGS